MNPLFHMFLVLFCAVAMGFDLAKRRIPNWLVLCAIIGGGSFSFWAGPSMALNSLLGFGLGVALLLLPFALGWTGAGDVKMLGAVGSLLGVGFVPRVFFYSALCGLVLGILTIGYKRIDIRSVKTLWNELKIFIVSRGSIVPETAGEKVANSQIGVPYGVAIGLGTLISYYVDADGAWAGF